MKRLLCLLFAAATVSCCVAEVIDFSKFPRRQCFVAGGTAEFTPDFSALQITWDPAMRKFMELSFPRPVVLGKFDEMTVTVDLKMSEKSNLSLLSLRVQDKNGEVFQFSKKVTPHNGKLVYVINGANPKPNGSWKANAKAHADKIMDFPVALTGMAIHFPESAGAGEVTVTSISLDKK